MSSLAADPTTIVVSAVKKFANTAGGLMPLLHEIQAHLGHIPKDSVAVIASGMSLSRAEVHGVISFYHDFHDKPRCQAMGSRKLEQHVKHRLELDFGGTTGDGRFSLEPVYCLGNCACSPSIRIGDEVFARVDASRFDELLDEH
jgi:formate dehydrogenase subunit gamma